MRDELLSQSLTLEARDHKLIKRATDLLRKRWKPHRQQIASAVRMTSGFGFQSINLDTHVGSAGVCAETSAIAQGVSKGQGDVDTIVSVRRNSDAGPDGEIKVISPCGGCREVICDYGPDAYVIIRTDDDELIKVPAKLLLAWKYDRHS